MMLSLLCILLVESLPTFPDKQLLEPAAVQTSVLVSLGRPYTPFRSKQNQR